MTSDNLFSDPGVDTPVPPQPVAPAGLDGTLSHEQPGSLSIYYRNARIGDVDRIMGSLKVNGQYRPIVVNIGHKTGRLREVLAGNHTLKAFRNLAEQNPMDSRWNEIAVYWVDVDEDQAAKIVLADNKTAELGGYDDQALYELIKDLSDIEGTGFLQSDVDQLAKLNEMFSGPVSEGGEANVGENSPDVTIEIGKIPNACAEVGLQVGVVRVKVPRDVYESWYDDLREAVGFDEKSLQAEVLARLGMGESENPDAE